MTIDRIFERIAGVRPVNVRIDTDSRTLVFEGIGTNGSRFRIESKIGTDIDKTAEGMAALSSALPAEFPKPKTMRGSHRPDARSMR